MKLNKIGRQRSLAVSILCELFHDAEQHRPSPLMYLGGEHLAIASSANRRWCDTGTFGFSGNAGYPISDSQFSLASDHEPIAFRSIVSIANEFGERLDDEVVRMQ